MNSVRAFDRILTIAYCFRWLTGRKDDARNNRSGNDDVQASRNDNVDRNSHMSNAGASRNDKDAHAAPRLA